MENQGWIKLHREIIDLSVFAHERIFKVYCLCLLKANHKQAEVVIPGILKPIHLKPGQFITGRFSLWEDYHQLHLKERKPHRKPLPAAKTVFRYLLTLQNMSILSIKSYNKYSIISISNWNRLHGNVHQVTKRRPSGDHKQECIRSIYSCEFFSVNEKQHEKYKKAYPKVDLIKEYEKMSAWLESNPTKRKTEKGYPRFINNWLAKADAAERDSGNWRDKLQRFK